MKVKWLIEPGVFEGQEYLLENGLKELGIEYTAVKFGTGYDEYFNSFDENDCVVFHGSFQLADLLRKNTKWIPGVICNTPRFDCTYYYPRFGKDLLNAEYVMLPFGEFDRRKDWLFDTLGKSFDSLEDNSLFIRPCTGTKSFTGGLFDRPTWNDTFFRIEPEELILVAPPQELIGEWRLVVADDKVIATSPYHKYRNESPLDDIVNYGQSIIERKKYRPDRVWTLDIAQIKSGELKVMEVGSFSCAGLYQCDPKIIIKTVNEIALERWQEFN